MLNTLLLLLLHFCAVAAAGQSPVGESFLMGQGPAGSATSGQWAAVCALVSAPLPGECSAAQQQLHMLRSTMHGNAHECGSTRMCTTSFNSQAFSVHAASG
jgi:hypothetical protein